MNSKKIKKDSGTLFNFQLVLLIVVITVHISDQKPSLSNRIQGRQRRSDNDDATSGTPLTEEEFQQSLLQTFETNESENPTNQGVQTENLAEGDILNPYEEVFEGEQAHNAVSQEELLWKGGIVPYTISDSFNKEERQVLARGMRHIQDKSCIQFVPRTTEADYIQIVNSNGGCYSPIGRVKGPQNLSLQRNLCVTVETTIHELMHALGFEHEHNRPDRDDHILINKDAMIDGQMKNFKKYDETKFQNFTSYDINSIMHYKQNAFAKDEKIPTIRSKQKKKTVGSIDGFLSPTDIMKLNTLYKCDLSLAVNVDCPVANLGSSENVCSKIPKYGCYCIVKDKKTRTEASRFCQDHQMQLVWLETKKEIEEVTGLMIENNLPGFWTAGRKMDMDTTWRWEQLITSASFPIKHFNWCPGGIPDNYDGEEYYIVAKNEASSKGCWDDVPDQAEWPSICKPPLSTKILMDNLFKLHSQLTVAFNEINDLKKKSIAFLGEIADLKAHAEKTPSEHSPLPDETQVTTQVPQVVTISTLAVPKNKKN